jgi:hypothetical protein
MRDPDPDSMDQDRDSITARGAVTPGSQHFFGFKLGSSVADPHWFQCGSGRIRIQHFSSMRTRIQNQLQEKSSSLSYTSNLNYLLLLWASLALLDPDPDPYSQCGSVRIWIWIQIRILNTAWEACFCILNNLPGTWYQYILKIALKTVTPLKKTGFNSSLFVSKRRLIPSPPL